MKVAAVVALAAVLCVVAVVAQHPRHCAAPAEFEAHVFQMDHKEQFYRRGHFAYDSRGERTSLFEEVMNGTDDEYFHTIHLFRERTTYRFNLKTKTCTKENLNHRFHRIEIPRDAHFVGDAIIGTNAFMNSGLDTTHWFHENKTEKWSWYGVYTERDAGCVPINDDFHDENIGHVSTNFYDVVLGISDPNVFVPDSACPRADAKPTPVPAAVVPVQKQTAGNPRKFVKGKYYKGMTHPQSSWTLYKQCDPSWANDELGTCGSLTICAAGCAMSSVAMILRTRGVNVNPDSLNSWLRNNGGYADGCDIVWGSVDRYGKTSFQGIEHADYGTICDGIKAGHGIIANVRDGSHWVLLTGCPSNGVFSVNDPGFSQNTYNFGDVSQEAVYH